MSATTASEILIPPITEAWYAKPFRFATLPKAAEKVWACIKFVAYSRKSSTITISDRFGAQWCTANVGVHVGRRCFQKGLKQLEDIGAIVRRRGRGWREITITVCLAGPKTKPKPKPRPTAGKARTATTAQDDARPAPAPTAPTGPPEPPPSPEECQQAAAALRALIAQVVEQDREQADGTADQAEVPLPSPATTPRRPRLHIPEAIRREIEEKERRRLGDELARLRAIAAERRTDDQERRIRGLAAELGEPGPPAAPSDP
jgi:hypothetical protein